jgi:HPt (histidine-containing phosphotransfer) domain-containing protein
MTLPGDSSPTLKVLSSRACLLEPIIASLGHNMQSAGSLRHATWIDPMSLEAASVPAIDMQTILQLAEGDEMGAQFVAEIIAVFLADLSKRVIAIGLQMSTSDYAGVKATAHAIKGSCGHFGASRLMELPYDIEDRVMRKQTDNLQAAIDSMVAETERVRAALEVFRTINAPP